MRLSQRRVGGVKRRCTLGWLSGHAYVLISEYLITCNMIDEYSVYLYILLPRIPIICLYGSLVYCVSVNMVVTKYGSRTP